MGRLQSQSTPMRLEDEISRLCRREVPMAVNENESGGFRNDNRAGIGKSLPYREGRLQSDLEADLFMVNALV
jgi:hypothetical protein